MSLQVWLPLNGNLNNQGLSNISVTNNGATVDNSGKIGKCYYLNDNVLYNTNFSLSTTAFSACCWVKFTGFPNGSNAYCISLNTSTSSDEQFILGIYSSDGSSAKFRFNVANSTGEISLNTWYHLCISYDGSKAYMYINGECENTVSNPTITEAHHLVIGGRSTNSSGTTFNGTGAPAYYNDIRIYDHCLSAKEVKELSKGLVLHYRLAEHGQENLKPNSASPSLNTYNSTFSSKTTGVSVLEWGATDAVRYVGNAGSSYTIFATFSLGQSPSNLSVTNPMVSAYIKNNSTANTLSFISNGGPSVSIQPGESKFCYALRTGSQTTSSSYFQINMAVDTVGGNFDFTIWHAKFEDSTVPTPWVPNIADALYSTLGYNSTTELDCSGYSNNGMKSGTITCDSDTPRYTTSYKFTGSQYIAAGRGAMVTDAITVSWWGYIDNWANYTRAISCTEGGGWNFEPNSGKMAFTLYRNGQYIHAIDNVDLSSYSGWHHFAATYDGYRSRIYVDGVLKATSTETTTKYPIVYNTTNGIFIAAEAASSVSTPTDPKFNGKLSDIRIYATALSATDIKELYNTSFSVDNTGKAYAYEYIES